MEEISNGNSSIVCGDWLRRIKPVIKNMSKRSAKYWTRLDEVVDERYKKFLKMTPTERLSLKPMKDPELDKEEYSRVKAIIMEMILKAIPKDLAAEAITKRIDDPMVVLLFIVIKFQPGSRNKRILKTCRFFLTF